MPLQGLPLHSARPSSIVSSARGWPTLPGNIAFNTSSPSSWTTSTLRGFQIREADRVADAVTGSVRSHAGLRVQIPAFKFPRSDSRGF